MGFEACGLEEGKIASQLDFGGLRRSGVAVVAEPYPEYAACVSTDVEDWASAVGSMPEPWLLEAGDGCRMRLATFRNLSW